MLLFIGANAISDLIKMIKIIKTNDQLLVVVYLVMSNPPVACMSRSQIFMIILMGQSC
jgi:hypothetical protein